MVETLETNVMGTRNLLQAVHRAHPRARVLVPGSALVYRPSDESLTEEHPVGPVTPYGLSKLAQEMLAEQIAGDGLPVLLTRSFTHLGPGQDRAYAASSFAYQIARIEAGAAEPVLRVGALDARRDLTDVRDAVRAYRALVAAGVPGRRYNVCTGRAHRMQDVLDRLLRLARRPISVRRRPRPPAPRATTLLLLRRPGADRRRDRLGSPDRPRRDAPRPAGPLARRGRGRGDRRTLRAARIDRSRGGSPTVSHGARR